MISAQAVRKSFGDFEAVKGIDFEVRRGECFGFLGPNGAGKSSTMRMIAAVSPTSGTLAPGASVAVAVDVAAAAQALSHGAYEATLAVSNATSGAVQFRFWLHVSDGALWWQVAGVRVFGILPLPVALFEGVHCREREHEGRYEFMVEAGMPWLGRIVRYEGWLEQVSTNAAE